MLKIKKMRVSRWDDTARAISDFIEEADGPLRWVDVCDKFGYKDAQMRKEILRRISLTCPDIEITKTSNREGCFVATKLDGEGRKTLPPKHPDPPTLSSQTILLQAACAAAKSFVSEIEKYIGR